jgi:hypothetical protein
MSQAKKFYKTTLCYLASACVSAFLWLVSVGCAALLFFYSSDLCLAKKINVLHCSVSKRQKNALAGGNTAEGLCAVGFVCWLKPKPCLWVGLFGFVFC